MISPEQLRRYPFFGLLADDELREIAMISDEVAFEHGETILREGDPAEALYFLLDGAISLNFTGAAVSGELPGDIPVGSIHPGEPFSISALIEPHILTADVQADRESRAIRIDALALRELLEEDHHLAYLLKRKAAAAVMERLHATRTQLAATWD